jgi:hypothetical protein
MSLKFIPKGLFFKCLFICICLCFCFCILPKKALGEVACRDSAIQMLTSAIDDKKQDKTPGEWQLKKMWKELKINPQRKKKLEERIMQLPPCPEEFYEHSLETHGLNEIMALIPTEEFIGVSSLPYENPVAIHLSKIQLINPVDDFSGDDLYAFYFVTDGHLSSGRVTGIYSGLRTHHTFFFNQVDRVIYPIASVGAKKPIGPLIVDFGLIESDGDNIQDLQKISSAILDMATVAVNHTAGLGVKRANELRKEVKNLSAALLSVNNDDRLIYKTYIFDRDYLENVFKNKPMVEQKENFKGKHLLSQWEYEIYFRFFKANSNSNSNSN